MSHHKEMKSYCNVKWKCIQLSLLFDGKKKKADGTEIDVSNDNNRYTIFESDSFGLVIRKVAKSDTGTYTCFVKSKRYGTICCSLTLTIKGKIFTNEL